MTYLVNEIYYTIQGEGVRYGLPMVFVRFAQCNLACGFCDTEFESYQEMTGPEIVAEVLRLTEIETKSHKLVEGAIQHESTIEATRCNNVLLCGGEPLLQVDDELVTLMKAAGLYIAIETNGTRPAPAGIDWIVCSPKVAEHAIQLERVNELKYLRAKGQGIPRPRLEADHYLLSPIFEGNDLDEENLKWCLKLVKENPQWRLTVQHHKTGFGGIR